MTSHCLNATMTITYMVTMKVIVNATFPQIGCLFI